MIAEFSGYCSYRECSSFGQTFENLQNNELIVKNARHLWSATLIVLHNGMQILFLRNRNLQTFVCNFENKNIFLNSILGEAEAHDS